MEILMNKKHLNRIQRRCAKLIQSQHSDREPFSAISTFREISSQKNTILQPPSIQDRISFKLDKFLLFCHRLKPKKNPFDELSRPKAVSCQKINQHNSFRNSKARQNSSKTNSNTNVLKQLNKTISFTFNQTIKTKLHQNPRFIKAQDEIDLKNDEFKQQHQSLKNYQTLSIEQTTGMQSNTITSNTLYRPSIGQKYQIKKQQDERKNMILQMDKINQLVSNQKRQTDDMMELRSYNNIHLKNTTERLTPQTTTKMRDVFDRKTTQKYNRLIDSIRNSEKYCIESYDDYDKMLTLRSPISKRLRPQRNKKILVNYAEEWR